MLEHALSKVYLSVGIGIYMLPSNLNLNVGRTKGYKNKILVSNNDEKLAITFLIVGTGLIAYHFW